MEYARRFLSIVEYAQRRSRTHNFATKVRCNRSSDMTRDVISDMASHVSCNQMRVINITFVGV